MAKKTTQETEVNTKWYTKNWFIITALILFAPLGIFLTFKYAKWNNTKKYIAVALSAAFLVYIIVDGSKAAPTFTVDGAKDHRIATDDASYRLSGSISGANSESKLTVNDKAGQINGNNWSAVVELKEGDNTVIIKAAKKERTTSETLIIHRTTAEEKAAKQAELDKKKAAEAEQTASAAAASKAEADRKAAASKAEADKKAAAEAERNKPKTSFGDGTYLVNKDIAAGTYRTSGGSTCYWERRSDAGGSFSGIISNENPRGQAVVSISSSDVAFKTQGCGTWSLAQ